ncbi:hypothetical protein [Paenibacillus koleovorans]|uniref:hypothetical protein n=1 Tax=Paenibacillus koleovorans TaxID=121608 RepID=UPI000FD8444D|nr:hypothetical protein [Paenibacillus koleovorans]
MIRIAFIGFAVMLLLSSCATLNSQSAEKPTPVPSIMPSFPPPTPSESPAGSGTPDLKAIQEKLFSQKSVFETKHEIQMMMGATGKDHIMMQFRSKGDVERKFTAADKEAIQATLYELAGEPFPLEITFLECCTQEPFISGIIKSYDAAENRVLIVHETKKNGNSSDPLAYFVGLMPDAILQIDGVSANTKLSASLVGRRAKVWTSGFVMDSYPGQTSAIKLIIE